MGSVHQQASTDTEPRILITGASGFIGRLLCPYLTAQGYRLRSFDRSSAAGLIDAYQGNLEDLSALRQATRGVDTLIHLAACADEADFVTHLVPANVIGLYNTFEAARLEGVRRFILASSCQAADLVGHRTHIYTYDRFPTDHYGLTKLWAEDMGALYSRRYHLPVLAIRLGWVVRTRNELARMVALPGGRQLFLSHRDTQRFFLHCLQADFAGFHVLYAFSQQAPERLFDMEPTHQLLGYEPQDVFPNGLLWDPPPLDTASPTLPSH